MFKPHIPQKSSEIPYVFTLQSFKKTGYLCSALDRKIIHIDMDAFFASVEQRDHPELRGKPVAVGGHRERGVVAAASYEARKYGVKSAMSSRLAFDRCPHIIFVKPRFEVYKEVSRQIRSVFLDYTDLVEPLSLDEAFLDVTHNKQGMPSATLIAKEIKQRIFQETQLVASAGISVNKFLAKVASDVDKPDGLYCIPPENVASFIDQLSVTAFFGVGTVLADKLHKLGVFRGKDLKQFSERFLRSRFGKQGTYLYHIARGIDERRVNPSRVRKSVGAEQTYDVDIISVQQVHERLKQIADKLASRIHAARVKGKTVVLKVKFSDFSQITRSLTGEAPVTDAEQLWHIAFGLFREYEDTRFRIRLLGISVTNFEEKEKPSLKMPSQLTIGF